MKKWIAIFIFFVGILTLGFRSGGYRTSTGGVMTRAAIVESLNTAANSMTQTWEWDGGNVIIADGQKSIWTDDTEADSAWIINDGTYMKIDAGENNMYLNGGGTILFVGSVENRFYGPITSNGDFLKLNDGVTQETYVIRKFVSLSGATDNAATNFFTITTTDETGSADGGMYSVKVHLTAGEATAASGAVNTASVSLIAHWTRIMASAGTGANSAIVEISESASADEGSGAISAVTLTVAETSEFVQQVQLQVNTSGGTFDGFALVELVYSDFTTAPVIQ